MRLDFSKWSVIVTGGTRGIGRAVSEAFLERGARVVATYTGNDEAARAFQDAWQGRPLETARFDVSDYSSVEKFFKEFASEGSSLEVLVNNAGIRRDNVLGMMPPEDWRRVVDTNLTGAFNMTKFAILEMMRNRFGRIVNITSPSGRDGFPGQCNYAASKAGLVAFTKSVCKEVGRKGVTANCVSPGFIDTELIADLPEEQRKEYKGMVPLKRFGTAAEVASAVLFLASKEASYINGAVLEVTGGL